MIRIVIALMVGGGFLMFIGFREMQLSSVADAEPQTIAASDLFANGHGDNAHVKVTDLFIMDNFVYEEKENNPGHYLKIWTPAIAENDPWAIEYYEKEDAALAANPTNPDFGFIDAMGMPAGIGMVIITDEVNNDREFEAFYTETELQGLIINKIDKLSGEELKLLKSTYPNINPDKVLILEHNRKPSSGKGVLMLGGGAVLFLIGPGLFLLGRNK